ncbi:MAG TPA: hypothetical protein DEP84_19615, partial [Chloroflexi bacterium]|nr:hypothetical protein [Chloroflexota bacterium]
MRKLLLLVAVLLTGYGLGQQYLFAPTTSVLLWGRTTEIAGGSESASSRGLEAIEPSLPWLTLEGPESGGGADTTVAWRATLTTQDGIPLAHRKLIFSLNYEGNREIPRVTDAAGRATFELQLSDSEFSSCCVDGASEPTRYVIRVRFDGDNDYRPTFVDSYQGYRSETADSIPTQTRIEQSSPVVTAGDTVFLTIEFKKAGSPVAGVIMIWESLDLGQYPRCTTDSKGRCSVTLKTDGRPTGSYGVSVMPKTNRPATDAVTIRVVNAGRPFGQAQDRQEQKDGRPGGVSAGNVQDSDFPPGGWYWWQHDGSPNPPPTPYQELGIFYQYEMRQIIIGWDSIRRQAVLDTSKLNALIDQAYARRYIYPDGSIGPQQVSLSYWLNTQVPPYDAFNPLGGGEYLHLSCAGGVATPPLAEAEFRARLNTIPQAFREWYDHNPKAQRVVVGFVFGSGFHSEWMNPFSDPACNTIYESLTGNTIGNEINRHERETETAWSQAFAGTGVVLNTQGPAENFGTGLNPPISPKLSQVGWPLGLAYKSSPPQRASWVAIGRARNTLLSCEDAANNFVVGGAFGDPHFPGHWSPAWMMVAQAAHFRCYELHGDVGDGWFDAFELGGTPSIPNFDTFAKEVITSRPCQERRVIAWWAHEAALGFRKTDVFPRNGGPGWMSDIYGDYDGCLVRREVEPTTALLRNDLPMPAKVDYFTNPGSRPGTLPWTGDGNQPTDTGVAFSARRASNFYFDIHDGFAAHAAAQSEQGGPPAGSALLRLRLVYLNNGGNPLTVA